MFSDEEFLLCLVYLVVPVFHNGGIVPNRGNLIVGSCIVCVYEACTVVNTHYLVYRVFCLI